jgi:hypothetical protein
MVLARETTAGRLVSADFGVKSPMYELCGFSILLVRNCLLGMI